MVVATKGQKYMSTELHVSPVLEEARVTLTEFWGGEDRGVCVQVTTPPSLHPRFESRFVQLTATEAMALSHDLREWALENW